VNRTIALFVALVMLVAHVLTIHIDARGLVAVAWDQAHVPFRLGRNLVFDGQLAWNPMMEAFESYPSVLWVLLCAFFERVAASFKTSVNVLAQTTGVACAILAAIVSSRLRPNRSAGLMAPLILATCGAFAAAAASGLETPLFALLLVAAFLAAERGRSLALGILLSLAVLTRPEAAIMVAGFALVRALGRGSGDAAPVSWSAFLLPLGTLAISAFARHATTDQLVSPAFRPWLDPRPGQWAVGMADLRAFALLSATPLLFAWTLAHLARRRLSRMGAHAAFLALAWMLASAARGAGTKPFFESFVPALPLLAIAVQEGLIPAFDSPSRWVRRAGLASLACALAASVLASKSNNQIGQLDYGDHYPQPQGRGVEAPPLARKGLHEEIGRTIRLRKLGHYLRWELPEGATILAEEPGAIGYISRRIVHDLLGRASPLAPGAPPNSWDCTERVDMLAALGREADYLVPRMHHEPDAAPDPRALAMRWREHHDSLGEQAGRQEALEAKLVEYELVTVRYGIPDRALRLADVELLHLLRKRALGRGPRLEASFKDGELVVDLRHNAETQIADLVLKLESERGARAHIDPSGAATDSSFAARTRIVVYASGARAVELWHAPLPRPPEGDRWTSVRAVLKNPGVKPGSTWARASEEVLLSVP
jgi:hypothetical protein